MTCIHILSELPYEPACSGCRDHVALTGRTHSQWQSWIAFYEASKAEQLEITRTDDVPF